MSAGHLTLVRHAESTYNAARRANGDPSVPVGLSPAGREQARALARALAGVPFDLAVRTRFPRTAETLAIMLEGRSVPVDVYPELDDVDVGDFEGGPVDAYRAWRAHHGPSESPPGGESPLAALARYVAGYERLLASGTRCTLVV